MRDEELQKIERRAAAATPGPWKTDAHHVVGQVPEGRPGGEVVAAYQPTVQRLRYAVPSLANAEFSAHARTDVPALVARVRELEADVHALRSRTECSGREVDLTDPNDACASAHFWKARADAGERAQETAVTAIAKVQDQVAAMQARTASALALMEPLKAVARQVVESHQVLALTQQVAKGGEWVDKPTGDFVCEGCGAYLDSADAPAEDHETPCIRLEALAALGDGS